jgi:hypothetical protein
MNLAAQNRRIAPRTPLLETVELVLPDGEAVAATALDLSESGIAIWATGERPLGPVRVRLNPGAGDETVLEARVAREFRGDGGAVWGLEFLHLGAADLGTLRARLARSA